MPPRAIEWEAGLRRFVVAVLLGCALGVAFRLYASDARIRGWIERALSNSGPELPKINFKTADIALSRGTWPEIALRLGEVTIAARAECGEGQAAAKMRRLEIPLDVGALLHGRLAAGVADAAELEVDVDAWRPGCGDGRAEVSATANVHAPPPSPPRADQTSLVWWQSADLARARAAIDGARADRARVFFERRDKVAVFERVEARLREGGLSASFRVYPPIEALRGERIPAVEFEGFVAAANASVSARAAVGEGRVFAQAELWPEKDDRVGINARAELRGVPASEIVRLARRAGLASGETAARFRPKFMWVNCAASIKGQVQGLFQTNPVEIKRCTADGDAGRATIDSARLNADGTWGPFSARVFGADVRAWLAAFGLKGPAGVFSEFGRVDADVQGASLREWRAKARLSGARAMFIHRDRRAWQTVGARLSFERRGLTTEGRVDSLELADGKFDGALSWKFSARNPSEEPYLGDGSARLNAREIELAPAVQDVMLSGQARGFQIQGEAAFVSGAVARAQAEATLASFDSSYLRARAASLKGGLSGDGVIRVAASAQSLSAPSDGAIARALMPVFLGHRFASDWIEALLPRAKLAITDSGLGWDQARAKFENGRILISSAGNVDRSRALAGSIQSDFPKVKRARFSISGPAWAAELRPVSKTAEDAPYDDAALGAPVSDKTK